MKKHFCININWVSGLYFGRPRLATCSRTGAQLKISDHSKGATLSASIRVTSHVISHHLLSYLLEERG